MNLKTQFAGLALDVDADYDSPERGDAVCPPWEACLSIGKIRAGGVPVALTQKQHERLNEQLLAEYERRCESD